MSPLFCRLGAVDGAASHATSAGVVAAVVLAVAAVVFAVGAATWTGPRLRALVAAAALFQAGHFTEHTLQLAGLTRTGGLTLTAWARGLAYGYAAVLGRPPSVGVEAMHFFGDLVYLSGIYAWCRLHRQSRFGRAALAVQAAHQAEHVALFATVLAVGRPIGLTTITAPAGAVRIAVHFGLNLTGSALWVCAALAGYRLADRSRYAAGWRAAARGRLPRRVWWRWFAPLGVAWSACWFAAFSLLLGRVDVFTVAAVVVAVPAVVRHVGSTRLAAYGLTRAPRGLAQHAANSRQFDLTAATYLGDTL